MNCCTFRRSICCVYTRKTNNSLTDRYRLSSGSPDNVHVNGTQTKFGNYVFIPFTFECSFTYIRRWRFPLRYYYYINIWIYLQRIHMYISTILYKYVVILIRLGHIHICVWATRPYCPIYPLEILSYRLRKYMMVLHYTYIIENDKLFSSYTISGYLFILCVCVCVFFFFCHSVASVTLTLLS